MSRQRDPEAIEYFDRRTRQYESEQVYGEKFLRWTYGTALGRLALHGFVKRALFSRWYGKRMSDPASRAKVIPFIQDYRLDVGEFAAAPESYRTFNEFFHRKLKPEARPIDPAETSVVFPADGRHLGFQNISQMDGVFVKGQVFGLEDLLQDRQLAGKYAEGSMVLSRLCPVDYHRFHFPAAGKASGARLINGPLYSVNPIALRRNIRIFVENKRYVSKLETAAFGTILMIEVGATCVGKVAYTYKAGSEVSKGGEKGYFLFGGSSTITLFEPGAVELAEDLRSCSGRGIELYARMGDCLGSRTA